MSLRLTTAKSLSEFTDGRDSSQFAEFPLAILSDSAPKHLKTIEFEDEIEDWGSGKTLRRKVAITGSDKWGLPTAKDEEVLLAIVQITKIANDFTNPEVRFTKRHVMEILGWPLTGWAFRRVEESLHRWKGVSIHYFNAWRDNENKTWQNSVALGVIEYSEIEKYSSDKRSATVRADTSSCIIWNSKLFQSLKTGYVKKLDFGIYRSLKRPVSKRAFRFLDKRFYHSTHWEFDLRVFACEKLGLSRSYDTGQLKERLQLAFDELQEIGFIKPVSYRKSKPKHWTVSVSKKEPACSPELVDSQSKLIEELTARQVGEEMAVSLIKKYPEAYVREKLQFFDGLIAKSDKRIDKNPPGFLVAAIQKNFKAPLPKRKSPSQADGKRARSSIPKACPTPEEMKWLDVIARMETEESKQLISEAIKSASSFQVKTYERLKASKSRLLAEFERALLIGFLDRRESASVRKAIGQCVKP